MVPLCMIIFFVLVYKVLFNPRYYRITFTYASVSLLLKKMFRSQNRMLQKYIFRWQIIKLRRVIE